MQLLFFLFRNPIFWVSAFLFGGAIYYYNKMVKVKLIAEDALARIEHLLHQRLMLIPQLEKWATNMNDQTQELWERLLHIQANTPNTSLLEMDLSQRAQDYYDLRQNMNRWFSSITYPDTEKHEAFEFVRQEFIHLDKKLSTAIEAYNQKARDYNVYIESFPSGIVAALVNLEKRPLFL